MIRLIPLSLCAALALPPALASAQNFVQRDPAGAVAFDRGGPDSYGAGEDRLVVAQPGHTTPRGFVGERPMPGEQLSNQWLDNMCGNQGWIGIWDEDAHGNAVAGTFSYECMDGTPVDN